MSHRFSIAAAVLAIALGFGTTVSAAEVSGMSSAAEMPRNRIEQLTGDVWLNSSHDSKIALLFGIELANDLEHGIALRLKDDKGQGRSMDKAENKRDRKRGATYTLSPFERGWAKAFYGLSLNDIAKQIDDWYAAHPDRTKELTMSVVWFELIEPKLKAQKAK